MPLTSANLVFGILRNAGALTPGIEPPTLIVCWGGHSINATNTNMPREVGNELGLREDGHLYRLWTRGQWKVKWKARLLVTRSSLIRIIVARVDGTINHCGWATKPNREWTTYDHVPDIEEASWSVRCVWPMASLFSWAGPSTAELLPYVGDHDARIMSINPCRLF